MGDDETLDSTLPRGATGFCRPNDGPLPETDLRAFRTALFAAARAAGGEVGELEEQEYPRTFHTAAITDDTGERVILCHGHYPWIAFAAERREWYTEEFFASPPPWADVFTQSGFVVLPDAQLTMPVSDLHASALTKTEWRQVRYYGITTLGGVLFNAWD
ncbi:hypothetical protein [Streptomyces sp. NPDC057877]|uniref:hypothetical protein n=1 Tax=Streptomyces sp. NPDC057877 TaxID=3346269 RepID=UPI0036D13BC7